MAKTSSGFFFFSPSVFVRNVANMNENMQTSYSPQHKGRQDRERVKWVTEKKGGLVSIKNWNWQMEELKNGNVNGRVQQRLLGGLRLVQGAKYDQLWKQNLTKIITLNKSCSKQSLLCAMWLLSSFATTFAILNVRLLLFFSHFCGWLHGKRHLGAEKWDIPKNQFHPVGVCIWVSAVHQAVSVELLPLMLYSLRKKRDCRAVFHPSATVAVVVQF